jgi:predicted dehydrogenase
MINMVMIGGGFISQYYKLGIDNSSNLKLVALADLNTDCLGKGIYNNVPFYTDYKLMIEKEKPQLALVCTGVDSHYEIIKNCLLMGIDVIVEKPLCPTMEQIDELYSIAHKNNRNLECIYHFSFGDEALWLKNNISKYGKIIRYSFSAHEQYAFNEKHIIIPEKRSLGDAWNDVSVNLLSDIDMVVDLHNVKKTREIIDKDNVSGLIRYAHKTFVNDKGVEIDILADWMTMDKTKISVIDLDSGRIIIDHHEQIIYFNGECIYKNIPKLHRMFYQYENYFRNFKFDMDNESKTRRLHKIIFE